MSSIRSLFYLVITTALASSVLTACGGGSASPPPTPVAVGGEATVVINNPQQAGMTGSFNGADATVFIESSKLADVKLLNSATGTTLSVPNSMSNSLATLVGGQNVVIPAGQDKRFPLGMAGRIDSVTRNPSTNATEYSLSPITFSQAYSKANIDAVNIPLAAENFIGAIAPRAISGGQTSVQQAGLIQKSVTTFGGALTVRPSKLSVIDQLMANLDFTDALKASEVSLETEFKLADLLDPTESSRLRPLAGGQKGEAKVVVSLKLSDIVLTQKMEYEKVLGVPYSLKSLDYKVALGKLVADVKLQGSMEGTLGFYSRAWEETLASTTDFLGVSAKLTGLDTKDKVGRIPLMGLVFSVPCPLTCPIAPLNSQTPIRAASAGGVIVWVYINMKGEITLDGAIGARTNLALDLGAQQPDGGSFDSTFNMKLPKGLANGTNLIEAPYLGGELKSSIVYGPAVDADIFLGGIRPLNISADIVGQINMNVKGEVSYALPDINQDWQVNSNACFNSSLGAGVLTAARFALGAEIKTGWTEDNDEVKPKFSYKVELPKAEDRSKPGWHKIVGIPAWYTFAGTSVCYPTPVLTSFEAGKKQDGTWQFTAMGKNLPADLTLKIADPKICRDEVKSVVKAEDAQAKIVFSCQAAQPGFSEFSYALSSDKATNLETKALSNLWSPASGNLNASTNAAKVGDAVALWVSNTWNNIVSVTWNFGTAAVQQTANVIGGVSDRISQVFNTTGVQNFTTTYQISSGLAVGSNAFQLGVGLSPVVQTVIITSAEDDRVSPVVSIANNASTEDQTPVLRGTVSGPLTTGHTVQVFDGAATEPLGVATVTGIAWQFVPTLTLATGVHAFTVAVVRFDGTPGPKSAAFYVNVQPVGISSVSPAQVTRTVATRLTIIGDGLPTSGLSVIAPGSRNTCSSPTAASASSFAVDCSLYTVGQQVLQVWAGNRQLGSATVVVKSNVTDVNWSSASTSGYGKASVKFGEMVTYRVSGVNLLSDPVMGFAVDRCGVANTEVGTASNTQRSFQCTFNNEAGAVAGNMSGVVKDSLNGQQLYNFTVPVQTAPLDVNASMVVSWDLGSIGTAQTGRGTNPRTVAVNAVVEIEGFLSNPMFDVDVGDTSVRLFNFRGFSGASAVFDASAFNGLVLRVPSGANWQFASASLSASNTVAGLTAARVTSQSDRVAINLQSLAYSAGSVVQVDFLKSTATTQPLPSQILTFVDKADATSRGWIVSPAVSFISGRNGGRAAKFGGVDSPGQIRVPNNDNIKFTTGATFDMWVRLDSLTGMNGFGSIVSDGLYAMSLLAKSHDRQGSTINTNFGGFSYFQSFDNTWTGGCTTYIEKPLIPLGQWYRVTAVASSQTGTRLYINKALIYECKNARPNFAVMNSQDLYIGQYSSVWYPLNGAIQDIQIFQKALSSDEIQILLN